MKLRISAMFSVGLLACGGSSSHPPVDGSPDTSGSSTTLTITTYRVSGPVNTQLVAVQDADGPWTALAGTAGVYTSTLHGDRYGVMTSCVSTTSGGASIYYGAVSDGTKLYFADCGDPGAAAAHISGTVTGAAAANPVLIVDGFFGSADVPAGTTTYTLSTLAGPEKLFAEELVNARPVKLAAVDASVIDGATVSFDLAAGFTASTAIGGASLTYRDAHGIARLDRATAPFTTFRAIPAAQLGSGLNRLVVSNTDGTGTSVIRYFKEPVDQSITFPAAFQLVAPPTATAAPYPNVHFMVPLRADASLYDLSFSTTNPTTRVNRGFTVEMTSAWVAKAFPGATTFAYTMPDFHGLAGWQAGFQAEAGLPLDWSAGPTKNTNIDWVPTVAPDTLFDHDGSELQFTTANGQLAAP
jgi:hypothetical protein